MSTFVDLVRFATLLFPAFFLHRVFHRAKGKSETPRTYSPPRNALTLSSVESSFSTFSIAYGHFEYIVEMYQSEQKNVLEKETAAKTTIVD
jgi:hypothetical protein